MQLVTSEPWRGLKVQNAFHDLTPQSFWRLADDSRIAEEYRIDSNLRYLRTAPLIALKKIFVQYRFFTIYYIADLALLVSKMPFGTLRSCLAEFLSEELGDGDPGMAHPQLYDDFLVSLGVANETLSKGNEKCLASLETIQNSLLQRPWAYGVGLRGMGGECLCQIYLSAMYEHFMLNPHIQERKADLAWKFWDIHTGEVDMVHRARTRNAISQLILKDPDTMVELAGGYLESKAAWDLFWQAIFAAARME